MRSSAEPLRSKPLALFALQALLLSLLIGFWPTPRALYPPLLRAQVGPLLGGGDGAVSLRASEGAREGIDTQMLALRPGDPTPRWMAEFSLLHMGWWPTAVLTALMLATPMSARRRAIALLACWVWIALYVWLRLEAEIAYAGYELLTGPGKPTAGVLHAMLRAGDEVLEANGVLIAVVLLAWVVLARPGRAFDASSLRRMLSPRRRA
jgi:hypothetical protein